MLGYAEEEQDSLSAIMLDDDYYNLTINNSIAVNGLRVASPLALIGQGSARGYSYALRAIFVLISNTVAEALIAVLRGRRDEPCFLCRHIEYSSLAYS